MLALTKSQRNANKNNEIASFGLLNYQNILKTVEPSAVRMC